MGFWPFQGAIILWCDCLLSVKIIWQGQIRCSECVMDEFILLQILKFAISWSNQKIVWDEQDI